MLYNSINHGVISINHVAEYTDHAVVCASHVDLLEIDQVASMFVYGKRMFITWGYEELYLELLWQYLSSKRCAT